MKLTGGRIPVSDENRHSRKMLTNSVRANVVACDTVELREFTAVNRADV